METPPEWRIFPLRPGTTLPTDDHDFPVYGYAAVNVEAQSRSLASLPSWTKRLISVRKSSKVFGRGSLSFIRPANRSVLVYVRQIPRRGRALRRQFLSRSAQAAEIDLSPWRGRVPFELLGRTSFPPVGDAPYLITLAPRTGSFGSVVRTDASKVEKFSTTGRI